MIMKTSIDIVVAHNIEKMWCLQSWNGKFLDLLGSNYCDMCTQWLFIDDQEKKKFSNMT